MTFLWRAAFGITGALLLAAGALTPAARADDQDGESTTLVSVSDLTDVAEKSQEEPQATAMAISEGKTDANHPEAAPLWRKLSPAGCKGSTEYPHPSGNMVSVHAVTQCDQAVVRAEVVTVVLRDRWWGWEYVMSGSSARDNSTWSGEATPHSTCRNEGEFMFRAYSMHASLEDGTVYKSRTRNWHPDISRFWC